MLIHGVLFIQLARSPRPCLVWYALNPTLRLDASIIHTSFSSLHVLELTGTDVIEPQLITARNEESRKADLFANGENCLRLVSECPLHRGYTWAYNKALINLDRLWPPPQINNLGFYSLDILNHAYANSFPVSYTLFLTAFVPDTPCFLILPSSALRISLEAYSTLKNTALQLGCSGINDLIWTSCVIWNNEQSRYVLCIIITYCGFTACTVQTTVIIPRSLLIRYLKWPILLLSNPHATLLRSLATPVPFPVQPSPPKAYNLSAS